MWHRSKSKHPVLISQRLENRVRSRGESLSRQTNLRLEQLEARRLLAITDTVTAGVLTISVDDATNIAVTSSGGNVQVNGGNPQNGMFASNTITAIHITCTNGTRTTST